MDESVFADMLGNKSFVKVLDYLLERFGDRSDFSKKDVRIGAKISESSLLKLWPKLEQFGLIVKSRDYGKGGFYSIDTKSELWRKLVELDIEASMNQAPSTVMSHSVTGDYVSDMEGK